MTHDVKGGCGKFVQCDMVLLYVYRSISGDKEYLYDRLEKCEAVQRTSSSMGDVSKAADHSEKRCWT